LQARRPSSSWPLGGSATWMFPRAWRRRAKKAWSRSLSTRTASSHDCSARSTSSASMVRKCLRHARKWSRQGVRKILGNRTRYERITKSMTMPWYFLAIIHGLEADFRFDSHLHNGDPLTGPHGPCAGWTTGSGHAAVQLGRECDGCHRGQSLRQVERLEHCRDACRLGKRHNGLGYRHYGIYSPYVWACNRPLCEGSLCLPTAGSMRMPNPGNAARWRCSRGLIGGRLGVAAGGSEVSYCGRAGRYSAHGPKRTLARASKRVRFGRTVSMTRLTLTGQGGSTHSITSSARASKEGRHG